MKTKEGFVEDLQDVLAEQNIKVSKETAWKIFKGYVKKIVDGVLTDQDNKIQLSGIGSFEMIKAAPRSSKEGVVEYVPRLRWRTSTRIDQYMEEKTGQIPDPDKIAAMKEKLRAEGKLVTNLPPRAPKAEGDKTTPKPAVPKADKPKPPPAEKKVEAPKKPAVVEEDF